jgi:hypothetical protein
MTCHQLATCLVDLARGLRPHANVEIEKHLAACHACAALFERERWLSARLQHLARDIGAPADHEPELLAAFDAAWARPRPQRHAPLATGLAAAAVMLALGLGWQRGGAPESVDISGRPFETAALGEQLEAPPPIAPPATAEASGPPRRQRAARQAAGDPTATEFVAWPGATAWPPFESGELIRVVLPIDGGVVEADVLVGQDGFARAVRLVQ